MDHRSLRLIFAAIPLALVSVVLLAAEAGVQRDGGRLQANVRAPVAALAQPGA